MALKLDMAKACDRVEWSFVEHCLKRFGFADEWTELLMKCVRTMTYTMLIEEVSSQSFTPGRSLRQGDPLSPFMFLLCAEGLSVMLRVNERHVHIQGIRITPSGPSVFHLFFADECILFNF